MGKETNGEVDEWRSDRMGKEWKQIERKNDGRRDRTDDQVSEGPRAHRCVNHYATASGCHLGDNLPICQHPVRFISPFDVLNLLLSSVFGLILSLCILIAYIPGGGAGGVSSSLLTSSLLSPQCVYSIPRAHCVLQPG